MGREQLWFDQPEANVACETCGRRVSLKEGRLRAVPGRPQFMLEEFYCGDCSLDLVDVPTDAPKASPTRRSPSQVLSSSSDSGSSKSPVRRRERSRDGRKGRKTQSREPLS